MNLNDLKTQTARAVLWWRSRPGPPARSIRAGAKDTPPAQEHGRLRVAAVQVRARLHESAGDFAAHMESLVRQAYDRGASLIVFPEDNGTQLLGMLPGLTGISGADPAQAALATGEVPIGEIFRLVSPYAWRAFTGIFAELAKAYRVFIVSGSIRRQLEDDRLVNIAYCYAPDGQILGSQEKLHLMREEETWGFSPGRELTVVQAHGFGLAFPICHDASYFETFRLAMADGASIVAIQSANPEDYNEWYARRGIWPRVQETPVYGIASHLVGTFLGRRLTGRSGIYAPLDLSPGGDGILAQAGEPESEEIVAADLDLAGLQAWREAHPLSVPGEVILRYLPELYRQAKPGRPDSGHQSGEADQQQGEHELANQQDDQRASATQSVAEGEADVEQENGPPVEKENQESQEGQGEEQGGQGEQVGGLGVTIDKQVDAKGDLAACQPRGEGENGGLEQPAQKDQ